MELGGKQASLEKYWRELLSLNLTAKYKDVKLTPIKDYEWGRECFLHDPSGILWHFGQFSKQACKTRCVRWVHIQPRQCLLTNQTDELVRICARRDSEPAPILLR